MLRAYRHSLVRATYSHDYMESTVWGQNAIMVLSSSGLPVVRDSPHV